jgi:hypothetical protein
LCLNARGCQAQQHQGQRGHQGKFLHRSTRFCCKLAALLWRVSSTFRVQVSFEPDWLNTGQRFSKLRAKNSIAVALRVVFQTV